MERALSTEKGSLEEQAVFLKLASREVRSGVASRVLQVKEKNFSSWVVRQKPAAGRRAAGADMGEFSGTRFI